MQLLHQSDKRMDILYSTSQPVSLLLFPADTSLPVCLTGEATHLGLPVCLAEHLAVQQENQRIFTAVSRQENKYWRRVDTREWRTAEERRGEGSAEKKRREEKESEGGG